MTTTGVTTVTGATNNVEISPEEKKRRERITYKVMFQMRYEWSKANDKAYKNLGEEEVVQCHIGTYPDYWFISNMGRVYSMYGNRIRQLKPAFKTFCGNIKWTLRNGNKTYDLHRMVAEHFMGATDADEVEHIRSVVCFNPDEWSEANRVSNLRLKSSNQTRNTTCISTEVQKVEERWTEEIFKDRLYKIDQQITFLTEKRKSLSSLMALIQYCDDATAEQFKELCKVVEESKMIRNHTEPEHVQDKFTTWTCQTGK